MIGRVCEVHGEYSATGACRWCEKPSGADQSTITLPLMCICKTCLRGFDAPIPLTSLVCSECRAKRPRKVHPDVPNGSMFCRCGEYAWASWCPPAEREGVIAGVAHSPEQCFKLDGEPPGASALRDAKAIAEMLGDPHPRWDADWGTIYLPTPADLPIQPPVVLEYQHAALRWERVARRWNWKHREPRWINEEWRAYVWRCWLEQMALRREGNLIAAGIPQEWAPSSCRQTARASTAATATAIPACGTARPIGASPARGQSRRAQAMSINAALARELGCEVRTFRNVQHAMRWYWRRNLADLSPDGPPDPRSSLACISSEADQDRDAATSVLIGRCLEPDDPEVDRFHLHYAGLFIAWCCSFDNQRDLAGENGMTLSELRRTMRYTETVVARRMRSRRLLA